MDPVNMGGLMDTMLVYDPQPFTTLPHDPAYLRWGNDAADVEETMVALRPHLKAGVSHWRLGSVCGAHPLDCQHFVEGRASLTAALRRRLREWAQGGRGTA